MQDNYSILKHLTTGVDHIEYSIACVDLYSSVASGLDQWCKDERDNGGRVVVVHFSFYFCSTFLLFFLMFFTCSTLSVFVTPSFYYYLDHLSYYHVLVITIVVIFLICFIFIFFLWFLIITMGEKYTLRDIILVISLKGSKIPFLFFSLTNLLSHLPRDVLSSSKREITWFYFWIGFDGWLNKIR